VGLRRLGALCLLASCIVVAGLSEAARGQGTSEFTLQAASFDPDAVAPSGVSSSTITIGSVNNTSVAVNLTCQVSSQQPATSAPVCTLSPASVTTPATATATVTTQSTTTTQAYNVTITGTGPTTTFTTPPVPLTVLAVSPQFTINVSSAVAPSSVSAGNGATGTVTVNPVYGYVTPNKGGITLSCASITPLVTIAPVCSFTYPKGGTSLQVNGTTSASATLNISTFGPITTGAQMKRGAFGLWLALPLVGLVGFGAATGGKRARGAWVVLTLVTLFGIFALTPACGNSPTSTTTPNGVTPANTYTFTIIGVDSNGVLSSNTSSTTNTSGTSATLTVTAPPKTP
jgi:hypothetical protein